MRTSALTLAVMALPIVALAQGKQDFSKVQVKATKVAGQVYVIEDVTPEFSGGNIGVSVGADGIALIDDKFAPLANKIEAALKTISDKPVRFVINTHYHGDHTDGNIVFGQKSTIIAHENTRKRMLAGAGKDQPPAPPAALPVITFEDKLSVHINGEEVRAIHFPSGHTDTDVVIFFTKSNVVHMGDDFFNGIFPFIDVDGGGSVKGLIANLQKLLEQIPADAKIIPGHGAVATAKELRAFLTMLKETSAIVEAGIKAKKTLDQLKKEKVLAKYDAWAKGFFKADDFIELLYKDLKR
ncbi:MAG: MBL fold metallo-hydrolase [Deltaproteobacteria bacterium]|nr:MAG: MBL fold metallo-hydrolase [Deltaproteobacteria bacterium]TMQ12797.1 MAG: MBL fold metallo-hydrolase [Deltaproteobacteria bacterium]